MNKYFLHRVGYALLGVLLLTASYEILAGALPWVQPLNGVVSSTLIGMAGAFCLFMSYALTPTNNEKH